MNGYHRMIVKPIGSELDPLDTWVVIHHVAGTYDTCIIAPVTLNGEVSNASDFSTIKLRTHYEPFRLSWDEFDELMCYNNPPEYFSKDDPRSLLVLGSVVMRADFVEGEHTVREWKVVSMDVDTNVFIIRPACDDGKCISVSDMKLNYRPVVNAVAVDWDTAGIDGFNPHSGYY